MDETIADRIRTRLQKVGLSARAASLKSGGSADLIRQIAKGRVANPRADTIAKLAEVLRTTPQWLMDGAGPEDIRDAFAALPDRDQIARDTQLAVRGTAAGSVIGADILSNEPLEYVPCPPGLAGVRDAYVLWTAGDSMFPRFESGDPLFVHPHRPVRQGDDVVVQVNERGKVKALVKRYVRQTEKYLIVLQFNPPAEIQIAREEIIGVHRILTHGEIAGL